MRKLLGLFTAALLAVSVIAGEYPDLSIKELKKAIAEKKARTRKGEIDCDEVLFDRLRTLRRKLADERDVPAYIIFSDATLREMARAYPVKESAFGQLPGIGEKKRAEFGPMFCQEIAKFLETNPRIRFD